MADPILDDKLEVEAAPSWLRSATAAFRYNNLIGSALSSDTLYESLFPSDQTPVNDDEIIQTVRDGGLEGQLGLFGHVKTRGELTAMVSQVQKETQDKSVLQAAGGQAFVMNMLAGVVDLPTLIAGPATAEVLAARGFGRLTQAAGSAIVTGTLQTAAQEVGLQAIQQTRSGLESVENIGGAVIGGAILGPVIAKAFGRGTVNKIGDGLKREIVDMADGRLPEIAAKAEDDLVDAVATAKKELDAAELRTPDPAAVPDPLPMRAGPSAPAGELDAVGRTIRPSEWALIKQIADDAGVKPHDILASLPVRQTDFHHAPGNLAKANQTVMRIGGGNPVLNLSVSKSAVAREAVANFANLKTMFEGRAGPAQVMTMASRVYGEQGTAKAAILDAHREWFRDVAQGPTASLDRSLSGMNPVLGVGDTARREFGGQYSIGRFNELVANAIAWGKEAHLHPLDDMRDAIQHPAVQKAAQAYKKFDDWMFDESVRSGLMRKGYKKADHLRHVYAHDRVTIDEVRFIATEKLHAQETAMREMLEVADKQLADDLADIEKMRAERLEELIEQGRNALDKQGQEALDKLIRDTEMKQQRDWARSVLGLRHGRNMERARAKAEKSKETEARNIRKQLKSREVKNGDPLVRERLQADLDGLNAKWATWLDGEEARLVRMNEAEIEGYAQQIQAGVDKMTAKRLNELAARMAKDNHKLDDRIVKSVTSMFEDMTKRAHAKHKKETGAAARRDIIDWAEQHAEGVFAAITRGQTGVGGNHGKLTGGNIRGGHQERNVYTPTRDLLVENWLNPDLFLAMEKQARQDGIDAVIARKFRRPMTEAEQRLAARDHPDAYWIDGHETSSIPDLDMRGVKSRMEREYQELRDNAKTPQERVQLTNQHIADVQDLEDMVSIARGTHATDSATGRLHRTTGAVQSAQFMWYMGKNFFANIGDTMKLVMTHGLSEPLAYLGLRMREKFDEAAMFRDAGRAELKEYASAVAVGLEHVNMHRLVYSTDVSDPFANSTRATKMEQFSAVMTQLGSKAFLINTLNDAMKTAAFGIAQHRLGKLALAGLDTSKLDIGDRNWLNIVGISDETLKDLAAHFAETGVKHEPGKPIRFDIRDMHPDLADRIGAALAKDGSIAVLTPDALSKPAYLRASPILKLMTQFSTFAMESGMGTMNLLGQRFRSGEINAPTVGMMAMVAVAWMTQAMSIHADGNPDKIKRFWDAHTTSPGFVTYTVIDRSGLLGPFGYLSNLMDDTTTLGARSLMRAGFGDDMKDKYPFSKKKFGQYNGSAWESLGGPFGRTVKTHAEIYGDILGSLLGQKYGKIPALDNDGRITKRTVEKFASYVPLVNAFYMRALFENFAVKPLSEQFPKR